MNFDDVSYVGVPEDNECIVNAVQIGKQLDLPPHMIRSWGDEFEEFLYIKKINGRMTYTQKSVEQFEWIKAMREKGYGLSHIRDQLRTKGFTYEDKSLGLINPNDINLMESIKTDVGIEVKNQLKDFLSDFKILQEQIELQREEKRKAELELVIDEQNQISEDNIKNHINERISYQNTEFNNKLNSIEEKLEERDINLVENLRETLKDEKIKALESELAELKLQQSQSKGLFGWLHHKKK